MIVWKAVPARVSENACKTMKNDINYMNKDTIMHAIQIRALPDDLYAKLKQASKMHHRSISGEMLSILEQALEKEYAAGDTLFSQISSVREKIGRKYGNDVSSVASIRKDRNR